MATGKAELAKSISQKTGVTQKQATEFISALVETIEEKLMEGDKVQLVGFGTFMARKRESREGRKPGTDEKIIIPARIVPVFKAGKVFKEKLTFKMNKAKEKSSIHKIETFFSVFPSWVLCIMKDWRKIWHPHSIGLRNMKISCVSWFGQQSGKS